VHSRGRRIHLRYSGTTFGIFRWQNGTATFVAQSALERWSSLLGFDPTKGNVYQIRYQWLGYGAIRYYIENPYTGILQLVHTIQYANSVVVPSTFIAVFPLHASVVNSGNATNLTLLTASMGAYSEGPFNSIGARFSTGNRKTGITTETNIFTIRNKTSFQSKTNRGRVHVDSVAGALGGGAVDSSIEWCSTRRWVVPLLHGHQHEPVDRGLRRGGDHGYGRYRMAPRAFNG
jgi:hypothetical protein